jgi:hypothetical protein
MPTTTTIIISCVLDPRRTFITFKPTGISAGGKLTACWPVPWCTPVMAKAQKKTKNTCSLQHHGRRQDKNKINHTHATKQDQSSIPKFLTTSARQ